MFQKTLATRLAERREDKGFTLIELLVVMIIIGILAAIAIPLFLNQKEKAYATGLKNDLRNSATYVEAFAVDHNGIYVGSSGATVWTAEGTDATSTALTGFKKSANTAALTVTADSNEFCISGTTTTDTAKTWHYASSGTPQLAEGACPAFSIP